MAEEDVALNRAIGRHGAELLRALHERLRRSVNILTHCNTGWLAAVDHGTALSAVYTAHELQHLSPNNQRHDFILPVVAGGNRVDNHKSSRCDDDV